MTTSAVHAPLADDEPPFRRRPVLTLVGDDVPVGELTAEQLGSRIVALSGRISAVLCRWLLLVAEFDRRAGYEQFGLPNTGRWLAYHCGISRRTASDHLRVALALAAHPALAEEMAAGRLSYSHVRAISRVAESSAPPPSAPPDPAPERSASEPGPPPTAATAHGQPAAPHPGAGRPTEPQADSQGDPQAPTVHHDVASTTAADAAPPADSPARSGLTADPLVDSLIGIARHGTVGQLEQTVRGLRTVDRHERSDTARREGNAEEPADLLDTRIGHDCRWHLTARLAPEDGATVDSALAAVARAEGIDRPTALLRVAEWALAVLADAGRLPRELRGDERAAVVIHIDAADVPAPPTPQTASDPTPADAADPTAPQTRAPAPDEPERDPAPSNGNDVRHRPFARLANGPGLPDAVAYRLICDGRLRTVVYETEADGRRRVLDVGRCQRLVTRKQFRALLARDGHRCYVPGCESTRRLHVHHVVHWLHGGPTEPDNEVLLCEVHHRKVHDGELDIRSRAPGRFEVLRPDGRSLLAHPDPVELGSRRGALEAEHGDVTADAATTRWDGTRLDRGYAISCLAATRERTRAHRRGSPPHRIRPSESEPGASPQPGLTPGADPMP